MSNADSFGTFLETLKRREKSDAPTRTGGSNLLTLLAASGPESVPDLMKRSGLGLTDFTDALVTMREAGLISLAGAPGSELVQLTPNGEQVARLAH